MDKVLNECQAINQENSILYNHLIGILESKTKGEQETNLHKFTDYLNENHILENKFTLYNFLNLISSIALHYRFQSGSFQILTQILHKNQSNIQELLTQHELFNIFRLNQKIFLFLLQENILQIDSFIAHQLTLNERTLYYFYEELHPFLNEKEKHEYCISNKEEYERKRLEGENDTELCCIIRKNGLNEFIRYLQENNLNINSNIEESENETNNILQNKKISMVEYSAFSGSLDIFTYLVNVRAKMTSTIWIYAIHGRNYEILHLIEEKSIEYPDQSYKNLINESILCRHNELTEYFLANSHQENNISNESENENENDENRFLMNENLRTYHYDKIYEHFSNKYLISSIFYVKKEYVT